MGQLRQILASEGLIGAYSPGLGLPPNEPSILEENPGKLPRSEVVRFQEKLRGALSKKFPGNELVFGSYPTGSPFQEIQFHGLGTRMVLAFWFFAELNDKWSLMVHCSVGWASHPTWRRYEKLPWGGSLDAIYTKTLKTSVSLVAEAFTKIEPDVGVL